MHVVVARIWHAGLVVRAAGDCIFTVGVIGHIGGLIVWDWAGVSHFMAWWWAVLWVSGGGVEWGSWFDFIMEVSGEELRDVRYGFQIVLLWRNLGLLSYLAEWGEGLVRVSGWRLGCIRNSHLGIFVYLIGLGHRQGLWGGTRIEMSVGKECHKVLQNRTILDTVRIEYQSLYTPGKGYKRKGAKVSKVTHSPGKAGWFYVDMVK